MSSSHLGLVRAVPPGALRWRAALRWAVGYAILAVSAVLLAVMAVQSAPQPTAIAFAILLFGAVCIVARPVTGVYLVVFLTVLGDNQFAWWYPFTQNMSSRGSVLFVHDSLIFSPLELYLALTAVVWMLGRLDPAKRPFERGALLWPVAVFGAVALAGFVFGVGTGGDTNVALWEVRPITYVPLLYVLASNLCTSRRHYLWLVTAAVAALMLESIHTWYFISTSTGPGAERLALLGYLEHSASLHFNIVAVWLIASLVIGERAFLRKATLALVLIPVGATYMHAERRSAVVALIGALILLAYVLFRKNRRVFLLIVPAVGVVLVMYLAAFWNVQGPAGLVAQSVKSAIAPGQLSEVDMSSNLYRDIERYNLVETVRAAPILGRGFGQKFFQVFPLPYIPFVWAEYLPHNSVLWIWMNMGLAGFFSMLYLIGAAIGTGAQATMTMRSRQGAVLALTATLFVVMYVIYAYVDIAWDTGSMVLLGLMLALIGNIARLDDPAPSEPDPDDRIKAPVEDSHEDSPFSSILVDFAPGEAERWAS
jgi:O-antigen ligase